MFIVLPASEIVSLYFGRKFQLISWQISTESCEYFKVTTSPNSDRATRKISFLQREIQVLDGVSDTIVSEIQKILDDHGIPLLKFGQQLTDCVESNSQFDRCLNNSKQFEVNNSEVVFIDFCLTNMN